MKKFLNFLVLYLGHSRSSKNTIFISSIGLILALTIFSSTNYFFDNSKVLIAQDYLTYGRGTSGYFDDIEVSLKVHPPFQKELLTNVADIVNTTQEDYRIDFFKNVHIDYSLMNLGLPVNISHSLSYSNGPFSYDNTSIQVIELNENLISLLTKINEKHSLMNDSKIPELGPDIPEAFILFFSSHSHVSQSVLFNYSSIVSIYNCKTCFYQVNVTGIANLNSDYCLYSESGPCIVNPNIVEFGDIFRLQPKISLSDKFTILFVRDLESFSQGLYKTREYPNSDYYYSYVDLTIIISFDYEKIDPFQVSNIISTIHSFDARLYDKFYDSEFNYYDIRIEFWKEQRFLELQSVLMEFLFSISVIGIPILIGTIFIISYSFNLVYKNIIKHIGIYKTRGASSSILFGFHVLDSCSILFFSIIVALLAGIPLTILSLRSDFLLSFKNQSINSYIFNFSNVSLVLLYSSIILVLLVNGKRIIRFSKMNISDTIQPVETTDPFWKKHYFDYVLFSFGLVIYSVFYIILKNEELATNLGPILAILIILLIPAPFAIILGFILIDNRFSPFFFDKVGTLIWNKTGNLLAFSFKNIIRHKQTSTRAVVLISLLITATIFYYSFPYSNSFNNEKILYYNYGAEGIGKFDALGYNETTLHTLHQNYSSFMSGYSSYIIITGVIQDTRVVLMLVNTSSYLTASYLHFDLGLKNEIQWDFQNLALDNNSENGNCNILIDQESLNHRKESIGSDIIIQGNNVHFSLHIIDTFKNWPLLKTVSHYKNSLLGIGDIDFYLKNLNKSLNDVPLNTVMDQGILFNFKSDVNQSLVANWIIENTNLVSLTLVSSSQKEFISGVHFHLQISQINNNVILIICSCAIILMMFVYFQFNERKKEIFTERALGMKLHQESFLFLLETCILSLTAISLGLFGGYFFMELLAQIMLNPSQEYPYYVLIFPTNLIFITIGIFILCSIIISLIPMYFLTKQHITSFFGET